MEAIKDARVLLNLGDSVTTDHISPAGSIARNSPAARYLAGRGYVPSTPEIPTYGTPWTGASFSKGILPGNGFHTKRLQSPNRFHSNIIALYWQIEKIGLKITVFSHFTFGSSLLVLLLIILVHMCCLKWLLLFEIILILVALYLYVCFAGWHLGSSTRTDLDAETTPWWRAEPSPTFDLWISLLGRRDQRRYMFPREIRFGPY